MRSSDIEESGTLLRLIFHTLGCERCGLLESWVFPSPEGAENIQTEVLL